MHSILAIMMCAVAAGQSTVAITPGWLRQQGRGPYILNRADTTYILETSVTTTGTAFVVLARNVTLDLNGHAVTYGNSSPITVPNGGFEDGSGTSVPGWDLTGAPTAALAANTNYLFGKHVLRLDRFSSTQTIVSDPIPISLIDHTYKATITPANGNVAYGTSVTINVVDAVTGKQLATGSSANTQRGFSSVAGFTPRTRANVRLQVVVAPPSGVTTSVDLDEATLNVSYDYGIVASGSWQGDFPGSGAGILNLPAPIRTAYDTNRTRMLGEANFTVKNGSIVQGRGNGANSSPLFFQYLGGFTVHKVTTSASGLDTTDLDAANAAGPISIRDSTFQDKIPNVTNRMAGPATISLYNTGGDVVIERNQILGSPQVGIGINNNNRRELAINDNTISQNAVVADAYAIGVVAVSNFQIKRNKIIPRRGEGICVDGFSSTGSNNGVIQNNFVQLEEEPNRETGNNTFARALRLRNNVDAEGPHTNIDISGNTFIATVGPGHSQKAYTVWISYANHKGAMNDAGINLHDNSIKAIVDTTSPAYNGYALVLDQVDAGINMTIWNNVLESNDTSLAIGGYNDGNINDVTFVGNTLAVSKGPSRPYTGILAGFDVTRIQNVRILNTALKNGATAKIVWSGSGTKDLGVGTVLNVEVRNPDGSAASGANIQVLGRANRLVFQGKTNRQGKLLNIPLVTATHTQPGADFRVIRSTTGGPFTIKTTLGAKTSSLVVTPSEQKASSVVVR